MAFREVIRHRILDLRLGILDRSGFWWLVGMLFGAIVNHYNLPKKLIC
ncbi:MAG: hypothetical protein QQW96_20235 [Tychonema bourrellyi B0820]|nr:hypothetical protein [Tychonema bourrellyi]MDQ2099967.1 hypothetical protein [Tychonema bourrellyi B0820]